MPQSRISFMELPFRARNLNSSELSKVFGGCPSACVGGSKDQACCSGYYCYPYVGPGTCEQDPGGSAKH